MNGVFDSKLPSLFHSEESFQLLFQLGVLFQPLKDGLKPFGWLHPCEPFHAPGKLFQPESGVFQLFQPWNELNGVFHAELLELKPNPDHGAGVFQLVAPWNEPQLGAEFGAKFDGKLFPQLLFQLPPELFEKLLFQPELKPGVKPGNPVPNEGPPNEPANGVLNM